MPITWLWDRRGSTGILSSRRQGAPSSPRFLSRASPPEWRRPPRTGRQVVRGGVHGSSALHHDRCCGNAKADGEIRFLRRGSVGTVPRCACVEVYKPDIAFHGERLPEDAFAGAEALSSRNDLVLVLSTSLSVHLSASLPACTLMQDVRVFLPSCDPFSGLHLCGQFQMKRANKIKFLLQNSLCDNDKR